MRGSSRKVVLTAGRASESAGVLAGATALSELVRRVSEEFGAPTGILDPRRGSWLTRCGAPGTAFPRFSPATITTAALGKPIVWRGDEDLGRHWLLIPVDGPETSLVAASGFAAPGTGSTSVRWGPSCPERALLAWGQSVADSLRAEHRAPSRPALPQPSSTKDLPRSRPSLSDSARNASAAAPRGGGVTDGSDRLLVARLIRRLRISDPPARFQQMATTALRTALSVEALAWVPAHHAEQVIVCGEIGGLRPNDYRSLLPGPTVKSPVHLDNEPASPPDPAIERVLAVSADAQGSVGWLIALNPLDKREFNTLDGDVLQPVAALIATQQVNARVYADLKELLFGVIRALTAAIDAKDPYTSGHSERVARIAVRLAEELGMTPNQRGDLYLMGLLHDVGKIGVDDAVLKKAGPLSPEEYREIQQHVVIGVRILHDLKKLNHLLPGVRHHHESLDGSGYPDGLAGEAIPYEARILAVADSYDAMSSTRPYRKRLTPSQIDEILRKGSGVQWDPRIIDALFRCRMDLELIRQKGIGESLQHVVNETLGRPSEGPAR